MRISDWSSDVCSSDLLPGLPNEAPRAQFEKWRFSLSYFNGFSLGKQRFTISSTLTAPVTVDTLYATEHFAVGGVYSVRGLRETSITNDKGFAVRNERAMPLVLPPLFEIGSAACRETGCKSL